MGKPVTVESLKARVKELTENQRRSEEAAKFHSNNAVAIAGAIQVCQQMIQELEAPEEDDGEELIEQE